MAMLGAFLSTLLPPTGPAALQLPATSHTLRLPVAAAAVSVPAGTFVDRLNWESLGVTRPEPLWAHVDAPAERGRGGRHVVQRPGGDLRPRAHTQLRQDAFDVVAGGRLRDAQAFGDHAVADAPFRRCDTEAPARRS